ncbi:hypothetical protein GGQ68_000593 [Sagittula marina]|uniref:PH domain-containing protein n=1 Tax=Sagittula marina TaxID=943940 RepID=A0A7W6DP23_9RHOB|nr:hypothetical protein [Sagittula marina]
MTTFPPDQATYIRTHWIMAALAMAGGMLILWLLGNAHIWTGAIGGLAAVAVRGWFLKDEALAEVWSLSPTGLAGPGGRGVALDDIAEVRTVGAAVQVITHDGNKHLIKFQRDPAATRATIVSALPAR